MAGIPPVLKPDTGKLVWLAIGFLALPKILNKVRP